jgi:hypothetical protein
MGVNANIELSKWTFYINTLDWNGFKNMVANSEAQEDWSWWFIIAFNKININNRNKLNFKKVKLSIDDIDDMY